MQRFKTVLLVEPNENDLILIHGAFAEAGIQDSLRSVNDVGPALAYLDGEGEYADRERYPFPSVLLLEPSAGGRRGLEVLRWLEKRPDLRRRLAVVVLSAQEDPAAVQEAYMVGANSYLVKPFQYNELVKLVANVRDYWLRLNRLADE